jgi:hypothetical protein
VHRDFAITKQSGFPWSLLGKALYQEVNKPTNLGWDEPM